MILPFLSEAGENKNKETRRSFPNDILRFTAVYYGDEIGMSGENDQKAKGKIWIRNLRIEICSDGIVVSSNYGKLTPAKEPSAQLL